MARYGSGVIRPVFFFYPPFPLQPEEPMFVVFSNGGEQLTAPLGRNVSAVRMFMRGCPFRKTAQRVFILHDEVVGRGQYLLVGIGEALFQIRGNPEVLADGVKEVSRSVKAAGHILYGYRTSFADFVVMMLFLMFFFS